MAKYDEEFKREVAQRIYRNQQDSKTIARQYGLDHSQSMSHQGNGGDNAAMEKLFGTLQASSSI